MKRSLIVTCVFLYISEFRELFGGSFIDKARKAYQINMLLVILLSELSLLKGFLLNNWLVLISNKFGYYAYYYAHCLILFVFAVQYYSDEHIWFKLCSSNSFYDKVFLDGFKRLSFFSCDCLLAFLLSKLAHGM